MEKKLTKEQSIEIIKQACDKFIGTKQDHLLIEQAIILIEHELIKSLEN
jgi:hypothetical protein